MRRPPSAQCPICDGLGVPRHGDVIGSSIGVLNYKVAAEICSACNGTGRIRPARPENGLLRAAREVWQRAGAGRQAVGTPVLRETTPVLRETPVARKVIECETCA
ncbi:hypothetical protein GCM10023169_23760 [Georgenia halophila]|uniref:Molecular chaperone DnaJ n=1 Tax=Georgenia halophila TaxID=620889 RepID=A0ABP8LA45_9MICO